MPVHRPKNRDLNPSNILQLRVPFLGVLIMRPIYIGVRKPPVAELSCTWYTCCYYGPRLRNQAPASDSGFQANNNSSKNSSHNPRNNENGSNNVLLQSLPPQPHGLRFSASGPLVISVYPSGPKGILF